MRILLISSYIFGYMDYVVDEFKQQGHDVEVLYYEHPPLAFQYKSALQKVTSGIRKLVGKNTKKEAREKALRDKLNNQNFDFTLVIHGHYLNDNSHLFLKSISDKYVAYFFDSLAKMPEQRKIAHHFDKVFSYEPTDCKNEGYTFITNFIPSQNFKSKEFKYTLFNIGGIDARFPYTQKLASYLCKENISFRFMLFDAKKHEHFEQVQEKLNVQKVLPFIKDCKIMLDIQRSNQTGLTFRVFEALGNDKKLITTNTDILDYDFYNPNNIYLLDLNNIRIPNDFLHSDFEPLPNEVVNNYTVKSWVGKIIS